MGEAALTRSSRHCGDRIDVVVKALHFNTRFLSELLTRIEEDIRPENIVPRDIVFSEAEIDAMNQEIRVVSLPRELRRRIEFFASQFEFCEEGPFLLPKIPLQGHYGPIFRDLFH
jgi:hypothetical protein